MKRWLSLLAATALLSGQGAQAADEAPLPSASVIAVAGKSCLDSLSAEGIDRAGLEASGWKQGPLVLGNGEPLELDAVTWFRGDGTGLIEVAKPGERAIGCVVIAKVSGDSAFAEVADELSDLIGQLSLARTENSIAWFMGERVFQAKLVGERGRRVIQITAILKS